MIFRQIQGLEVLVGFQGLGDGLSTLVSDQVPRQREVLDLALAYRLDDGHHSMVRNLVAAEVQPPYS